MYPRLLGLFLFACQIYLNASSVIPETRESDGRDTVVTDKSAAPPEGYVRFPEVHAAYKLYEVGTTWTEARGRCIAEGTHLAIVDSVEKVEKINSLKSDPNSDKWVHVGIHQWFDDSPWLRVDNGLPPSSIPWKEGNPDGTGNCAGISFTSSGLVDYTCDWAGEYFACEIPI